MRKLLLFVPALAAAMLFVPPALACGVGQRQVIDDTPRDTVAELRAEAARLDSMAMRNEQSAMALERDAETMLSEARALRTDAMRVSDRGRRELLAMAEDLTMRASRSQHRARDLRTAATESRMQARALRERANRLVQVNGGGGWRGGGGRPIPRTAGGDSA